MLGKIFFEGDVKTLLSSHPVTAYVYTCESMQTVKNLKLRM